VSVALRHCWLPVLVVVLVGCGFGPSGPRVRYAHATPEQLAAAENERAVWYEFQPGDELTLAFALLGMGEMASDQMRMVVKRPFWIVVHKGGRTDFSFDNKRLESNPFSRWGMAVGKGEHRGKLMFLMYVGVEREAPASLRR
jgi:hypothetical protein